MSNSTIKIDFKFDNTYAAQLEGFYTPFIGNEAPAPKLIKLNKLLAKELGLDLDSLQENEIAKIFSGGVNLKGAQPLAQVYAGHQFGGFNPRLGDGRALLLGEVVNPKGERYDIHLKGSGRTLYSRGGDGKAALGPVLREYIMGEAMHALNVPTTRALAAVVTGEKVMRENALTGAVLARVGMSHLRVGTFQYFAAKGEVEKVKQLADYTIQRHFPSITNSLTSSNAPYLDLLCKVRDKQVTLLSRWMLLGFIHGVMNTDNMTISGETIDYGPCAFMDSYDPATVFSSIDSQGRYAYGNQPAMAQWNLARLAEALLPLINSNTDEAVKIVMPALNVFPELYEQCWLEGMRSKFGLTRNEFDDLALANDLLQSMEEQDVDFTQLFRGLAESLQGGLNKVQALFNDSEKFDQWHVRWVDRLSREPMDVEDRVKIMNAVNPIYIPRNHIVEEALHAAEVESNYEPFETLMDVLAKPFEKRNGLERYELPAPSELPLYKTFCGT